MYFSYFSQMARRAFWAWAYFRYSAENAISFDNPWDALIYRLLYDEYCIIESDSELEESLSIPITECNCEACINVHGSRDSVFGDTVYSADIFAKCSVNSSDVTVCSGEAPLRFNTEESFFYGQQEKLCALPSSPSSSSEIIDIEVSDDEDRRVFLHEACSQHVTTDDDDDYDNADDSFLSQSLLKPAQSFRD